jgi:predicted SprT family Zn-dependent metalloprotease
MELPVLERWVKEEFARHGLVGWSFGYSRARRMLGVCRYNSRRIEISRFYAENNPEAHVRDTLLHEIAHALAGHSAGHGPAWQECARRLGAKPVACARGDDAAIAMPQGDWRAACPACGKVYTRYRRPSPLQQFRCRCEANPIIRFVYAGENASAVDDPIAIWMAVCGSCGTQHQRAKRPRAGVWTCACPLKSRLVWKRVWVRT